MGLRIENAIDLHCHFGPDTIGRKAVDPVHYSVTGYDAAKEAYESGHKAIVLKSHSFCSCQLSANLQQVVPGLQIYGGACTDHASGGLSVETVASALISFGSRLSTAAKTWVMPNRPTEVGQSPEFL